MNLMDVGCTLDLRWIIDFGCGLLHLHWVLSAVAELLVHLWQRFTEYFLETIGKEFLTRLQPWICIFSYAYISHFSLLWPWPWPNDLCIQI